MNRSLVWFAVLYGEITSAVVLIVLAGYAAETQTGQAFCAKTGMTLLACKGTAGILILVLVGYATTMSFRQFLKARREQERKGMNPP